MREERGGSAAAQEGRYLQQLRVAVLAVAARRGHDLFRLHRHVAIGARDGDAHGVKIARAGRFRCGRRDRRSGIRVHGRGECGGAAIGHGGSIDALDDGLNTCVHGLLCLRLSGIGDIVRRSTGLRIPGLRGVAVGVIAIIFRRSAQRRVCRSRLRFGGGCPPVTRRAFVIDGAGIEGAEAGRRPGDRRGAAVGRDPGGDAVAVGEGVLHRLG